MIISESWLREWVSPEISTEALAELLTQAGLEVETVTPQPRLGDKVVVGKIVGIAKHPDADKLNVCKVDVGGKANLTIVCGAPNAAEGLVAPVALSGAILPSGTKIAKQEVRGVASSGMICSASELGLEDQSSGLMSLDAGAPVGVAIEEYLGLDDVSIDIDLTPDRGDCLSILGVARDIAAMSKTPLNALEVPAIPASIDDYIAVSLQAPEACPRYAGRIIKNIDLSAQTPDYMKEKLRRLGVRSISPVVDVTNYVMLELGQPMHAFDLDKIDKEIIVRMAKPGEKLGLLDGQDIELDAKMLLIADAQKPIALAGIMGGANSEIDDKTSSILLEAAHFSPLAIAGKARMLGMHTDASHRFERGVDASLQVTAIERATGLLLEIVGGECGPVIDQVDQANLPSVETITFRPQRVRDVLGLAVTDQAIAQHLRDLQMVVNDETSPWSVTRPSWRFDVTAEHDLVEEIGRLEGLDKIEPNPPELRAQPFVLAETQIEPYTLKSWLASAKYREIVSYSFIDPADQRAVVGQDRKDQDMLNLANPIASNMSQMRLSILPGLLNAARANEQRQHSQIRLFEMGNIFSTQAKVDDKEDTGASETSKLALVAGGAANNTFWSGHARQSDFYDLKGDLDTLFDRIGLGGKLEIRQTADHPALHPGQSGTLILEDQVIGFVGTLHPSVQQHFDLNQAYVVAEIDLQALLMRPLAEFSNLSKFPQTTRDLALVVKESVLAGDILKEIRENTGKLLKKCEIFDIYSGDNIKSGYKSLAFSLSLQSESESLTSGMVDKLIDDLLDSLKAQFGATLRE